MRNLPARRGLVLCSGDATRSSEGGTLMMLDSAGSEQGVGAQEQSGDLGRLPGPGQVSLLGGLAVCAARPPATLQQTFVEAVLVHVPIHVEVLPRREGQLGFRVLIGPIEGVVAGGRDKLTRQPH